MTLKMHALLINQNDVNGKLILQEGMIVLSQAIKNRYLDGGHKNSDVGFVLHLASPSWYEFLQVTLAYSAVVDVNLIASRFIEALKFVDTHTTTVTHSRQGTPYLQGIQSMNERDTVREVVEYWKNNFPYDFVPPKTCLTEHPYPESKAKKADILFESLAIESSNEIDPEKWAVEAKRFQFVGDNGKNNDFGVAKMFSPYLKDHSLAHDAKRLAESSVAERKTVLVYGFEYDRRVIKQAMRQHPTEIARIREIERVCRNNNPENPSINFDLLIDRVVPNLQEVVTVVDFADFSAEWLWRHPCGGRVRVLAWEIKHKN